MKKQGKLIALCGAKGSGKTLIAEHLVTEMGFTRISFAAPMRDMLEAIGVTPYYHTVSKNEPIESLAGEPTARELLVTLGTSWGRECVHTSFWCSIAMNRVTEALVRGENVVIDDMRFPNEFDAVAIWGGTAIKVLRGTPATYPPFALKLYKRLPSLAQLLGMPHESELHWPNMECDIDINNNGSINSSITQLEDFLEDIV